MVTSVGIERGIAAIGGGRTVVCAAILVALAAFAKENARGVQDLPKPVLAQTAADSAFTPAPTVKAPVLSKLRKPLSLFSGMASWYGKVLQDHKTASGERFDSAGLTAAHRSLPFGSKVKVTDLRNRKSVIVTITDRGVLAADRIIDLSFGAAQQLDMIKSGVDPVRLEVLTAEKALADRKL
jgi:rare lipoprotein A